MTNEEFKQTVKQKLMVRFTPEQIEVILTEVEKSLKGLTLLESSDESDTKENRFFLDSFLSAKRVEGCSDKTIKYYETTLEKCLCSIGKLVKDILTDDLRKYLADYQLTNNSSKVTIDNIRRILSSFFSWLEDEDYIVKSPVRRIRKVKTGKVVKDTLNDEQIETLRDNCDNIRDLALIEFLTSTGVRVGELVQIKKSDINFQERSCVVLGKGNSEREVYFDARTKLHLQQYLSSKSGEDETLFCGLKSPFKGLGINGVENLVKRLGNKSKLSKIHPHKFRRTLATMAIDKGMPIEQVQKLLGHVRIDTTLHYAMVNQTNVKNAHRKYIG
jgi:site-specific recombinase XerD